MTREQKYAQQLRQLGIYQEAFDPEIHTLAIMERELQRLMKRWKAEGSPVTDVSANGSPTSNKTWDAITELRRDILAHRDALGLTPKALRRLKPAVGKNEDTPEEGAGTVLEVIRGRHRAEA